MDEDTFNYAEVTLSVTVGFIDWSAVQKDMKQIRLFDTCTYTGV